MRNEAFPLRGRWHGEAVTDEVRPRSGRASIANSVDIAPSASDESATVTTFLPPPFVIARKRALCPSSEKLYEAGKTKRICNDITSSAHEPSALDRRSQCNLNRRSSVAKGRGTASAVDEVRPCGSVGVCVTANSVDIAHCHPPQTGGVCPSGGVFFPFVSERKRNQKEREFKGLRP